VKKGKS